MHAHVDLGRDYEVGYRIRRADGAERWMRAKARILGVAGFPVGTLGLIWDDTERKKRKLATHELKELAEVTLASIGDAVVTTDRCGQVRSLNRVAEYLLGWSQPDASGKPIEELMQLVNDINGVVLENPVTRCLRTRTTVGVSPRIRLVTCDYRNIAIEDSAAPIWSGDVQLLGAVAVFRDVSHERELTHQVRWQAAHDALTGLINRREFEKETAHALAGAKTEGHHHALLYMDLDRFKVVNDTCGHAAGDVLLQTLSRMLPDHMRDSDILARLGGGELGVLLRHCPMPRACLLADGLRQAIHDFRFAWGGHTFSLGVSIGLVEIEPDSSNTTELLMAADQACYLAKESGRNRVRVYRDTDALLAQRRSEVQWVTRLNEALAHGRFQLFGQPIMPLGAEPGCHEEVLIRIAGPGDVLTLPGAFIPAAERYDLMAPLDRWVIAHVCRHIDREIKGRRDGAATDLDRIPAMYSINLSGMSLNDEGMFDHIASQFERYGVEPRRICFEITETAIIANLPKAQDFIARCRQLGCLFSLDDFGSGLSSFAYLRSLPVDFLKIDGVFVRDIVTNRVHRAMVKAINEVGHEVGIRTVAEYVETSGPSRSYARSASIMRRVMAWASCAISMSRGGGRTAARRRPAPWPAMRTTPHDLPLASRHPARC
jgi:diguanylate cyclase (GGDEF)-like protein/PAS domain S-box-containing protein